jgi:hypothetical protein
VCVPLIARDQGRDAQEMTVPGSVEGFEISDLSVCPTSVLIHKPHVLFSGYADETGLGQRAGMSLERVRNVA